MNRFWAVVPLNAWEAWVLCMCGGGEGKHRSLTPGIQNPSPVAAAATTATASFNLPNYCSYGSSAVFAHPAAAAARATSCWLIMGLLLLSECRLCGSGGAILMPLLSWSLGPVPRSPPLVMLLFKIIKDNNCKDFQESLWINNDKDFWFSRTDEIYSMQ